MAVDINLMGLGDIHDALIKMDVDIKSIEESALKEAAEPIQRDAMDSTAFTDRNKIPSERLRNNILISKVVKKRAGYRVIKVYCKKREASLVEYGHSGNTAAPHPFLAPAYERHEKEAVQIIYDRLAGALLTK